MLVLFFKLRIVGKGVRCLLQVSVMIDANVELDAITRVDVIDEF